MVGWSLCLLFALCASVYGQATINGELCELFAIRREGVVFFRIDTHDTQNVIIPDEFLLTVNTIHTTEFIINDQYVFSLLNDGSDDQVVIRKRVIDDNTGLWLIPRPVRPFLRNGTLAYIDGDWTDLTTLSLWELRNYLKDVNAESLSYQKITDPFADSELYTPDGTLCKDTREDCISVKDELFTTIYSTATASAKSYFKSLAYDDAPLPAAGSEDYAGAVSSLSVVEVAGTPVLTNNLGRMVGQTSFRLLDNEVQDVFVLEASAFNKHEVIPGVCITIVGWRGGQVHDFSFSATGQLVGGHVITGPFPLTDSNDIVHYDLNNGWSNLQVSSPGPFLRLSYARNTRIYVKNAITTPGAPGIKVSFNLRVPADQDGSSLPPLASTQQTVFEFRVSDTGSHLYGSNYETEDSSLFGAVFSGYSSNFAGEWDRHYVQGLYDWNSWSAINGRSYPGTVSQLGGWFKDRMDIVASFPASDDSGDIIVQIANTPRQQVKTEGLNHPPVKYECPAYGGPVIGRHGTGCTTDGKHVHPGHQISSTSFNPGHLLTIDGHIDRLTNDVAYSINGEHYAIRDGNSIDRFRIRGVGSKAPQGGFGGSVYIWRLHKADSQRPEVQNNGFGGSYMRFNYGEEIGITYVNPSDSHAMHLQGHQFKVIALDGMLLEHPLISSTVFLPERSTMDVVVRANNPNQFGAWMHYSTSELVSNDPTALPWAGGLGVPGGMISLVDYTGAAQGRFAVDKQGETRPFNIIPPVCTAKSNVENFDILRDVFKLEVTQDGELVTLTAAVDNRMNSCTERPIIDAFSYMWRVTGKPAGSENPFFGSPRNLQTSVRHFTTDGVYTFEFTYVGHNVEQQDASINETCSVSVSISVNANKAVAADDLDRERTVPFGAPLHANIGGNFKGAASRGHISHQLFKAPFTTFPDRLDVTITLPNVPTAPYTGPINQFNTGVTFDRQATINSIGHIWNSREMPQSKKDAFTLGRISFDGRVVTYGDQTKGQGWIFNADIEPTSATARTLPNNIEVVLPLWQGRSSYGRLHDVYFLITESSDKEFCQTFGCTYTPALLDIDRLRMNKASIGTTGKNAKLAAASRDAWARARATNFLFTNDPAPIPIGGADPDVFPAGYSNRQDGTTQVPTDINSINEYSPLKYFTFNGREVVANMPVIYWDSSTAAGNQVQDNIDGGNPTKQAVVDAFVEKSAFRLPTYLGGCSVLYRSEDPSRPWMDPTSTGFDWDTVDFQSFGPGPDCSKIPGLLDSHMGGQLTRQINFKHMVVVMKAHQAVGYGSDRVPFYILTDASDVYTAQTHGIPYAPRLNRILPGGVSSRDFSGISTLKVVSNGPNIGGGPDDRFQPAITTVTPDNIDVYSPIRHVTNLLWNCGRFDAYFGNTASTAALQSEDNYLGITIGDIVSDDQISDFWVKRNIYQSITTTKVDYDFEEEGFTDPAGLWKETNFFNGAVRNAFSTATNNVDRIALPFSVTWGGKVYTHLWVTAHGLLRLDVLNDLAANIPDDGCCVGQLFPNSGWSGPTIAPLWGQFVVSEANLDKKIKYTTVGESPNRVFVLAYQGVLQSAGNVETSFQVKFFEHLSHRVELHYKSVPKLNKASSVAIQLNGADGSKGPWTNYWYDAKNEVALTPTVSGVVQSFAISFWVPRQDTTPFFGDASQYRDIAQIFGNVKGTFCPQYAIKHTKNVDGKLYSGMEYDLLREGYLVETETPVGAYLAHQEYNTIDNRPAIWNTPHVLTWDWTRHSDVGSSLKMSVSDSISTDFIGPGSWVILWNKSNLFGVETDDLAHPLRISQYFPIDSIVAYRKHNVNIDKDILSRDPPKDSWVSNRKQYEDLRGIPTFTIVPIASNVGRTAWFTILESDNEKFARLTGANYVPNLAHAPTAACDINMWFPTDNLFDEFTIAPGNFHPIDNKFTFAYYPNTVSRIAGQTAQTPELRYSSLRRFAFEGHVVTINAPLVQWGNGQFEKLLQGYDPNTVDLAPCDENIRSNLPSNIFAPYGPPGCLVSQPLHVLSSYAGGQLINLNIPTGPTTAGLVFGVPSVTMKLHKGQGYDDKHVPYFSVWDASELSTASLMGIPYVPRLARLGRATVENPSKAVTIVRQYANGVPQLAGGPSRFEVPLLYSYGDDSDYSGYAQNTWLFYNCEHRIAPSTSFIDPLKNIAFGAVPITGSGIAGFDPKLPNFDPFTVRRDLKGRDCSKWISAEVDVLRNAVPPTGQRKLTNWEQTERLLDSRLMFETDGPAGALLNNPLNFYTIVNQPQGLYLNLRKTATIPAATPGRDIAIYAIDSAKFWYVSVNGGLLTAIPATTLVNVVPGDRVRILTRSTYTQHGLAFRLEQRLDKYANEFDLDRFFLIKDGEYDFDLQFIGWRHRFLPTADKYYYGAAVSVVGDHVLFAGTVRDTAVGSEENTPMTLEFTDYVHGPNAMNVKLRAVARL